MPTDNSEFLSVNKYISASGFCSRREADKLIDVHFVGRLANYKYFNMDQAFKNALDLFDELERENNTIYKTAV